MMDFLDAMHFRHSCKAFDSAKEVSKEDEKKIIEYGRMSPSSFGFEPWHFLVIRQKALREQLRPACWNQPQITDSTFVVVYLTYQAYYFRASSDFFRQRMMRRSQTEERLATITPIIMDFLAEQNTQDWAKRQTYIALGNMMTGAASMGIDSCPIEGFNAEKVKPVLADYVDWSVYEPVVMAAYGYRLNEQTPRIREPLDKIATFI